MALPTLSKTWQFSVNNAVPSTANTSTTLCNVLLQIKNSMKGFGSNPWTVSGSSNAGNNPLTPFGPQGAAAMDGVDRWSVSTDINSTGTGGRHSWIVLRQTGIASNYEICLEPVNNSLSAMTIVLSPTAGFTGGSVTARPTATDEIVMQSALTWIDNVNAQFQVHVWQSSDGQCTRVMAYTGTTNMSPFWLFDKIQNPNSGLTLPSLTTVFGASTGIAITYTNLTSTAALSRTRAPTGVSIAMAYTGESNDTNLLANITGIGDVVNDIDSNWLITPIGLYTITGDVRGRHGNIFDLWWKPNGVADGSTFPNDAANRQFVAFGPLILPWKGDSTVPLLV